jgi:DNA-binding transcriptional ArsR family regulator
MDAAKALADETRVRLLMALEGREVCVCQLIELVGLAPSTVSKHMSILRHAGLVEARKDGRWMFYRHPQCCASPTAAQALTWVRSCLNAETKIQNDRTRMTQVLEMDPEELCRKQCCR